MAGAAFILAALGGLFFSSGSSLMGSDSVETSATVSRLTHESRRLLPSQPAQAQPVVYLRFNTANGRAIESKRYVSEDEFAALHVGDRMGVRYLPSMPTMSEFAALDGGGGGNAWLEVLLSLAAGGIMIYWARILGRRGERRFDAAADDEAAHERFAQDRAPHAMPADWDRTPQPGTGFGKRGR